MTSYRSVLRLARGHQYLLDRPPVLDSQALGQALDGVVARQIGTGQFGELVLDVTLNRASHEEALNDLFALAQQYGYTLLNGEISKLVSSEVEAGIMTALGGGGLGATSNNGWVVLVGALAGGIAGWLVGSSLKRVEVVYEVRPNPYGGWNFSPKIDPGGEAQPGLAWT